MDVPCGRILSQIGAGPSGRVTEEFDSDDAEEVNSGETHVIATTESDIESHPGEGMLIKNPRSSVVPEDVRL